MARIIKALMGYPEIPASFPILVWDSMAIIEPAFAWLIELATIPGRSHADETVRTYGEHLYEWFDSLEQSSFNWRTVSENEIAIWRNRMLSEPSPHTKRPYSRSTINDRVRTICRFYGWLYHRGWIAILPFHFVDVRVRQRRPPFLAHVSVRPDLIAANVLTIAERERLPRALRVDQLRAFFKQLKMPYRLIAEWAVTTGMRRKELCGLTVGQIPKTAQVNADDHPLVGVPLTITKGGTPRTSYPSIQLLDRTHRYINEERGPLMRHVRTKRTSYRDPSLLFLNRQGSPISKSQLTRVFSKAFRDAGVDGTGHWLRHTFAMTMLVKLQQQAREAPDINPLKVVQVLLGHNSIQSTSVYLRCVEMNARDINHSIAWLYGSLVDDAS